MKRMSPENVSERQYWLLVQEQLKRFQRGQKIAFQLRPTHVPLTSVPDCKFDLPFYLQDENQFQAGAIHFYWSPLLQ